MNCPKCKSAPKPAGRGVLRDYTGDAPVEYHMTQAWECGSWVDERGFQQVMNDCRVLELERCVKKAWRWAMVSPWRWFHF